VNADAMRRNINYVSTGSKRGSSGALKQPKNQRSSRSVQQLSSAGIDPVMSIKRLIPLPKENPEVWPVSQHIGPKMGVALLTQRQSDLSKYPAVDQLIRAAMLPPKVKTDYTPQTLPNLIHPRASPASKPPVTGKRPLSSARMQSSSRVMQPDLVVVGTDTNFQSRHSKRSSIEQIVHQRQQQSQALEKQISIKPQGRPISNRTPGMPPKPQTLPAHKPATDNELQGVIATGMTVAKSPV
jgi:hypothetical protein